MKDTNDENFYEAALFDLDGVLIDSEDIYTSFWDKYGARFGKNKSFAYDIKGTTLSEILALHFAPEIHEELTKAIHDFEDNMQFVLFDGVDAFLDALEQMHIPMAIVTSSDDKKMRALTLQHPGLTSRMKVIVDGSMVSHSKPHPEPYLRAAQMLGKDPSRCIVFEDSLQGLESGRRAGCKVVGFVTTNPRNLVEPLCDVTVVSWKDITPSNLGFKTDDYEDTL